MEIGKRLKINHATVTELAKEKNLDVKRLSYHDTRYSLSQIELALSQRHPNAHNKRFLDCGLKLYNDYWKLDLNEFMLCCDGHVPFIHEGIFEKMLKIRQRYKIENLVYPGDFWDELTFSYFDTSPEDIVDFDEEIKAGKKIAKILTDEFKNVYFTMGNHDVRLWKRMIQSGKATENTWKVVWNLLENKKINISKYRYCEINNHFRVTHPKYAMRVGGLPAIRLRAKFDKSIILAHGHWWGHLPDPSGKYDIIAPGCMCDPDKMAYVNAWDTAYDRWIPGFMMVTDRTKPTLFRESSPWGIYLR